MLGPAPHRRSVSTTTCARPQRTSAHSGEVRMRSLVSRFYSWLLVAVAVAFALLPHAAFAQSPAPIDGVSAVRAAELLTPTQRFALTASFDEQTRWIDSVAAVHTREIAASCIEKPARIRREIRCYQRYLRG